MVFVYHAINFSDNGASNFPVSACKSSKLMKKTKVICKKHVPKAPLHPMLKSGLHTINILLAVYIFKMI